MELTREERKRRIIELEQELVALRAQESKEAGVDEKAVINECRTLMRANKRVEATKLYRSKMGCGLREAHYAVMSM